MNRKMRKKRSCSHTLPLNVKSYRKPVQNGDHTELAILENGVEVPSAANSLKSWILSTPHRICVSRNKLGKSLLKCHRNGFQLDDPHLYQTRFYVEYHRLQDPGLKRYFNTEVVRKRLAQLNMVTEQNDVICTRKEFADYLRYLERLESLQLANTIENVGILV